MKRQDIEAFTGETVRVTCNENGVMAGDGFPTGLMVAGQLQQHPEEPDAFRVVMNDDNYAYFWTKDVDTINTLASKPTIVIAVPEPETEQE